MMAQKARNRDEQVIFAFTPANATPDEIPVLAFIIPNDAWAYMANGRSHDFDLGRVGLPLKIIIGRTKTHATGMKLLEKANQIGKETKDVSSTDLSFDAPETKQ
jgi:hypothetical protein